MRHGDFLLAGRNLGVTVTESSAWQHTCPASGEALQLPLAAASMPGAILKNSSKRQQAAGPQRRRLRACRGRRGAWEGVADENF